MGWGSKLKGIGKTYWSSPIAAPTKILLDPTGKFGINDVYGGGKKTSLDGKTGNVSLDTLTADQKNLMNKYLASLQGGVGKNIETIQGYAEKGFNPYDAVEGDRLVGEMRNYIEDDAKAQIDALKGGAMNRFSLASNKAMRDIDDARRKQLTELNYKNLMDKAGYSGQAYQNQINAIGNLFNQSNSLMGLQTFQNQQTYNPGLLDRLGQVANIGSGIASVGKMFIG